jgi:hypothetical protein
MSTATRRRAAIAIAGATAGLASVVAPSAVVYAAPAPTTNTDVGISSALGDLVAQKAYDELNASSRNVEIPFGSNCNFYSNHFNVGSNCGNGYRSQQWCADFAKFVWKNAGVGDWQSTTSLSLSFRTYGVNHGTWHKGAAGVQAGDAAVYDDGDGSGHVGIVVVPDGDNSLVISGNYGHRVSKHRLHDRANFQGYSRPVG